jgi:hypothetical protein
MGFFKCSFCNGWKSWKFLCFRNGIPSEFQQGNLTCGQNSNVLLRSDPCTCNTVVDYGTLICSASAIFLSRTICMDVRDPMSVVFQNIDPPPPFHPASVSSPRILAGRGGGGGSIFLKTPDIGLASYSIISLRW